MIIGSIVAIFCLLVGYIWGKAVGNKLGEQTTKALIPLILRQHSFEKGYCVLCHRMFYHTVGPKQAEEKKRSC